MEGDFGLQNHLINQNVNKRLYLYWLSNIKQINIKK